LSKQPAFVNYAKFCQERQSKEFTDAAEKLQYLRSGIDALEEALRQCFMDIDQEIAMAIRGQTHTDANKPYHPLPPPVAVAVEEEKTPEAGDDKDHAMDDDGDSGTTAVVVLVTPDWLVCANAGDSRSIFSKSNHRAVPLSYDHKPDDEEEEKRIRAAGGYVAGGRVEGDLAVSRGLGDFRFKHLPTVMAAGKGDIDNSNSPSKTTPTPILMTPGDQKVSPVPDIILQNRNHEQDEFLVLACDGIWDVRSNQECVTELALLFQEGETNVGLICEEVRGNIYINY
jgi:hypothetical protein